jgi:cupin superfamily acireductone dioxygenase involved in methionine salvage
MQVPVKTNAAYADAVSLNRPEEYSQHQFSGISQAFLQPHHHSAKEIFWSVNNQS